MEINTFPGTRRLSMAPRSLRLSGGLFRPLKKNETKRILTVLNNCKG
jgi:hypothetical protein